MKRAFLFQLLSSWGRALVRYARGLLSGGVELTWPSLCAVCEHTADRAGLCAHCRSLLQSRDTTRCTVCDQDMPVGGPAHRCGRCLERAPAFERVFSLFDYGGPIGEVIRRAKYGRSPEIMAAVADDWLRNVPEALVHDPPDAILPVPLHWRRRMARGFSMPLVLAAQLSKRLDVPLSRRALLRHRATPPQAGLNERARRKNLRGAFRLRSPPPKDVLLVDDVFTTGATADVCARVLRRGGAQRVRVLTLATVGSRWRTQGGLTAVAAGAQAVQREPPLGSSTGQSAARAHPNAARGPPL